MNVSCYSRRIMAPFQGTLQVIRAGEAEAECRDGVNWVIYLTSENILSHTGLAEVRYGSWSQPGGLSMSRVQGSPGQQQHDDDVSIMLEALQQYAATMPFPAADSYEQWLLHHDNQQPILLLNSAVHPCEFNPAQSPYPWRPSKNIMDNFHSEHGYITDLINVVQALVGKNSKAVWIKRESKQNIFDLAGKPINDFQTSPIGVNREAFASTHHALLDDYLAWESPALLQLDELPDDLRGELEVLAWQHPRRVEELYRFYPRILDEEGLQVSLVKAKLLGKQDKTDGWEEPFIPFTNE